MRQKTQNCAVEYNEHIFSGITQVLSVLAISLYASFVLQYRNPPTHSLRLSNLTFKKHVRFLQRNQVLLCIFIVLYNKTFWKNTIKKGNSRTFLEMFVVCKFDKVYEVKQWKN